MKYLKGIMVAVFIGLLLLMRHYDVLFQTYGVAHSLDMNFGYTANDVYSAFRMLGSSGRRILLHYYFTDYIFILCYGAIQICLYKWVLGKRLKRTKLRYLNIIPYVRGVFDIAENAFFIFLLLQMPKEYPLIIPVMSYVTQIKLIANGGWLIVIVAVGIIRFVIHIRDRNKNQDNIYRGDNEMKKLGVFYFSGTGNTEIAARHVVQAFTELGWNVELIRIEDVNKKKIQLDINQYDLIGLGSQVIGYGIPGVVRNFARALPATSDNKKIFIFRTAGGVVPSNYNVSKKLIRILKHKHYDVCYEEVFSIGSNWIMKYDDVIMKQLYMATIRKITRMCKAIDRGESHFYKTGIALRLKMGVIAAFSLKILALLGKDAVIDKSCTACGLCVNRCPAENISIEKGTVKFHTSCSACLRCVYFCPNHAINFRLLHFVIIPGGYNVKKSLSTDGNPDEKPTGKIPPFFQGYVED